jgi:hypothetical protein
LGFSCLNGRDHVVPVFAFGVAGTGHGTAAKQFAETLGARPEAEFVSERRKGKATSFCEIQIIKETT